LDAQVRGKLKALPALDSSKLWSMQKRAIENLERSLAKNNPRSLIQMGTGSGKTFTAVNACYRLTSSAGRGGCCSSWTAATSGGRRTGSSSSP
ncbi:MAG: DEAD/DEAH box helicase family protein, partial [Isosphaeraceae bacterium]